MTKLTDLSYTSYGLTITFWPESNAGQSAVNQMIIQTGSSTIPRHWLPSFSMQLKAAGYIVRKKRAKKPQGVFNARDEALLAKLFA